MDYELFNPPATDLAVVVPVYNGERYIKRFWSRVPDQFKSTVIFVDDGSTDGTHRRLDELGCDYRVHAFNSGKGQALQTGICAAVEKGCKFVIVLDIDLQHPPELIGRFSLCIPGTLQLGNRQVRKSMPVQRKLSNFLTSLLLTVRTDTIIRDSQCGFRSFPVSLIRGMHLREAGFQYESEFLIKAALQGNTILHHPIPTVYSGEPTAMQHVRDTLRFVVLWFRSYLWT